MSAFRFDMSDSLPEEYLEFAASLSGLSIDPSYRREVLRHFARLLALRTLMLEFPLPEQVEPAPIFHA